MKRRRLIVEVVGSPRADGGRPSDGRQDRCLLKEVKHAKLVGDEVQTPKEEGLGRLEGGWNPHPNSRSVGNSNEPKRVISLEPAMAKMAEKWAIR